MSTDFGGESRDAFLTRLRQRMHSGSHTEGHPGVPWNEEDTAEQNMSIEEKSNQFARAWQDVGGKVKRASTLKQLYATLLAMCLADGVKRVLYNGPHGDQVRGVLSASNVETDLWEEMDFTFGGEHRNPDVVNAWDAGIVWVDYAVAELGSVVVVAGKDQGRSVSLLPPRFYAVISPETLVYRRRTVFEYVSEATRRGDDPSAVTFITGPSRSADIEMDLSIGVHGPGEVTAILLEV